MVVTMVHSQYKDKDGGVLLSFSGVWISYLHTVAAYSMSSLELLSKLPSTAP